MRDAVFHFIVSAIPGTIVTVMMIGPFFVFWVRYNADIRFELEAHLTGRRTIMTRHESP